MIAMLVTALRAALATCLLCGLLYPLAVCGLAQILVPDQANGSLDRDADGTIIGSSLIGQRWDGPEWFHGRPSATTGVDPSDATKTVPAPYNAASSTGSNLGPTSQALKDRLVADREALELARPELAGKLLPADMLTASASGLDPDISPANAFLQAPVVARARGVPTDRIDDLIRSRVTDRSLDVFGEKRVNVMALNLALRRTYPPPAPGTPPQRQGAPQ
jgi:K+-transporting ATPase ATPase C chain